MSMTASMSKRQQARNERELQHLIISVAGNDRCADCQARNPGIFPILSSILAPKADWTNRMGQLECKCEHHRLTAVVLFGLL